VETGATVRPLRHRQTKGAETDTPDLTFTAPHSYSTAVPDHEPARNKLRRRRPRSALAELTKRFDVATPIDRKQSRAHVAMKRGVWPIVDTRSQSMLEWIDIIVFDMARVISFIADQMLPETAVARCRTYRAPCERH
jgi:ATP-dependent exoDNAse (exonuclease V) beta subunit